MLFGPFQPPKPAPGGLATVFLGPRTTDAKHPAMGTGTPYIGVTSNPYLRVKQLKEIYPRPSSFVPPENLVPRLRWLKNPEQHE
jgi:hypothetical protein